MSKGYICTPRVILDLSWTRHLLLVMSRSGLLLSAPLQVTTWNSQLLQVTWALFVPTVSKWGHGLSLNLPKQASGWLWHSTDLCESLRATKGSYNTGKTHSLLLFPESVESCLWIQSPNTHVTCFKGNLLLLWTEASHLGTNALHPPFLQLEKEILPSSLNQEQYQNNLCRLATVTMNNTLHHFEIDSFNMISNCPFQERSVLYFCITKGRVKC